VRIGHKLEHEQYMDIKHSSSLSKTGIYISCQGNERTRVSQS
jgi:hypothetical protein